MSYYVLRELAPEAREMLGIPESHYMKLVVGFGYPVGWVSCCIIMTCYYFWKSRSFAKD